MTKADFPPPRVRTFAVTAFAAPAWGTPAAGDSFRNLRPLYLVYRKQSFAVSAVRFKFEDEQRYGDWQAVAVVPGNDICPLETESHEFLLLGFVSPGVPFDAELRCCDTQGRIGIAAGHRFMALEGRSFELARL